MSSNRERVTHPSWCDRDACTAVEFRPTADEYRELGAGRSGLHASKLLAVSPGYGANGGLTVQMQQLVAPWVCGTFLVVRTEDQEQSWTLGDEQSFLLYELLGKEVEASVREYPRLYAERFPYVQRAIEDEADEATADASTPRDPVELEEQMAAEAHAEERKAKGCTHPADEPCFGKTRKALYPMSYRLTVNGKTDRHPTFPELRAAVADLVTRRLAVEPERVAGEAQSMNAMFTDGTVQQALDERAEWYTVFDAYGEEPLRIRITAERD
jgi:hypothetical protein